MGEVLKRIEDILIERDGMDAIEATHLVRDAQEALAIMLVSGQYFGAGDICHDFFNLEEDYVVQLLEGLV